MPEADRRARTSAPRRPRAAEAWLLLSVAVLTAVIGCGTPRTRPSRFDGDLAGLERRPSRTLDELHVDPGPVRREGHAARPGGQDAGRRS